MKRQLSFRFLGILLGVTALFALGGHVLHGHQVKRNAGYLLTQGKEATARKDYPTALRYLGHYLSLRPDDAAARARYGVLLAKLAKTRKEKEQAFLTIEQALREGSDLDRILRTDPELEADQKYADPELATLAGDLLNVRRRAIELAIDLYQFNDARVHIDVLRKDRPDDAELLVLRGTCEENGGQPKNAAAAYDQAIRAEPGRVEAYARLAALYRRTDQVDAADGVIARMIEANKQSVRARLAATRYYRVHNNLAAARSNLEAISAEAASGDKDVLLVAADLALAESYRTDQPQDKSRLTAEARDTLRRGLDRYPDEPTFPLMLAELELRAGRRAEAVAVLQKLLASLPKQSAEAWAVADLLINANERAEARKVVGRLKSEKIDAVLVDFLDARLLLAEGRAGEAEGLLQKCRTEFARNPSLGLRTELLLASCYELLGKPDLRLKAAELARKIDPVSTGVRLAHAAALLAAGDVDEALAVYRSLIARDDAVRLTIARVITWQNRLRPVDQRNLSAAYDVLDGAPAQVKQTAEYHLVRAGALAAEGKKEKLAEARRVIEAARNKYPKEPQFWIFLSQVAAATSPADGLATLDLARAEVGDHVALRLARAALLTRQQSDPAALKPLEAGAEAFAEAEQTQLFLGLAEAYLQVGAAADAERLFRQVIERRPGDLGLLTRLFEVVAAKENPAEIAGLRDKIRAVEGEDGSVWRFAEALEHWLLYRADRNQVAALLHAQTRLAEAGKRRPDWFRVPLLEGEIEDRQGHPDAAIEKYLKAIDLGARQTALVTRTSTLLMARGRDEQARQLIDSLRRRSPVGTGTPELEKLDALNLFRLGEEPDQVVKRLEQGVSEKSTDYRDHLFRGGLFASLERMKQAEAAYRRAVELKPDAPEVWVALIRFLVQSKREADARAEVEKAARALPADKKVLALGHCYEAVGDRAEAEKQFTQAAREAPTDPVAQRSLATFYLGGGDAAKAEPILRRLMAEEGNRRWARRTLALALAASGDYQKGTEALALLEANLQETPDDPQELRTRSLLMVGRPGGRQQSIKDLEASFARTTPEPSEEFLLAQLYEMDGNWQKANDRLLGLLARRGGDNPAYMAYYVRALLRHKDLPGAAVWLGRLEAREKDKNTPRLVELQARVWAAQGDRTRVADRLKKFAQEEYEKQGNPAILLSVGRLLAELKLTGEAEEMLRRYVTVAEMKTPAAVLVLAEFLARHQNRVADALALCSGALAKANPELVGQVAVAVVRLGEATDAHYAQAETILQQAARAKPESVDITVSLADLRDAQGRYDDAKRMYRDILARAPRTSLAMNNLAWLLALHEGNGGEALRVVNQAIEIRGPEGNLLDTRGVIQLTTGDTAQAVADLTAAVAQQPQSERYFHLAQAHHKAGKLVDAMRAMRKARDLGLTKKDLHRLEWTDYDNILRLVQGR